MLIFGVRCLLPLKNCQMRPQNSFFRFPLKIQLFSKKLLIKLKKNKNRLASLHCVIVMLNKAPEAEVSPEVFSSEGITTGQKKTSGDQSYSELP